ncbi:MAG: alpha-1,2-fucosyltransferase [Solirubrobacterales bacterium]
MITARLTGGMGNQMFQYAAARSLAERSGVPLRLDLTFFRGHKSRDFALRLFALNTKTVSSGFVPTITQHYPRIDDAITSMRFRGKVVREKHFHFDDQLKTTREQAYLIGFWQSEQYFSDVAGVLRGEFKPQRLSEPAAAFARRIAERPSVSVHARRGDYVNDPIAAKRHGVCSVDYYERALGHVLERVPDATPFVFSDDPAWSAENLPLPENAVIVSAESGAAHEEIHLMSLCSHNIIANSSFSWWGAWLGKGSGRIVVAPSAWFAGSENDTRDLIPDSWVRL